MAKKKSTSGQRTFNAFHSWSGVPEGYHTGDKPNCNVRRLVEVRTAGTQSVPVPRR
jgi:hypothetical protein